MFYGFKVPITFKNKPGCKMIHFLNHWLVITSGALLLFVAIDRYQKICRPFRWHLSIKSVNIAFLVIVNAAMVYSVGTISIVDVAHVNVTEEESGKRIEAFYCTHSKDPGLKTAINLFHALDLLAFITIIGGCIVLYVLISRALWVSRKHLKHANKGRCSNDSNLLLPVYGILNPVANEKHQFLALSAIM
ncbi:hypothetical protein MAR_031903 [Mya arenaria]|uniref:G-protein coupled receptors family 1 profile domain-containing protein n=1 Tax=Mya arenaria TaxID=6604 RepID=A0ABY7F7F8_MYAAR|nr:hypothetical protein MAR_031903 [Mya arenaria]